jgi:hypothetical protein
LSLTITCWLLQTDLVQLYQSIPFNALVNHIPLPPQQKSGKGCKPWLSVAGGFGLQVLKNYLQLSDEMLIQRINTDWNNAATKLYGIQGIPANMFIDPTGKKIAKNLREEDLHTKLQELLK